MKDIGSKTIKKSTLVRGTILRKKLSFSPKIGYLANLSSFAKWLIMVDFGSIVSRSMRRL